MSKPRKLSRPEIEALAAFFGCRVATGPNTSNKDTYGVQGWWDVYILCNKSRDREMVGTVATNNPAYLDWTNVDWTKAFQRVSGMSTANLWDQGKRGGL